MTCRTPRSITDQIDHEFTALRAAYDAYRVRFAATYDADDGVIPLTVRQFAAAEVLCEQAEKRTEWVTVVELRSVLLVEGVPC